MPIYNGVLLQKQLTTQDDVLLGHIPMNCVLLSSSSILRLPGTAVLTSSRCSSKVRDIGLGIGIESRIILPGWKKRFVNKAFRLDAAGGRNEI